jgi:hypothetical protein
MDRLSFFSFVNAKDKKLKFYLLQAEAEKPEESR